MAAKGTTRKKTTKKSKSSTAKKVSARKTQKQSQRRASKAGTKKKAAKKAAAKVKPKARKTSTTKKAAAPKATRGEKKTAKTKANADDEVVIAVDDLADVDDLVQDPTPPKKVKDLRKTGPRTPSVPRTVKPTPKVADIEMDAEVLAFVDAIDTYKQQYSRPFPTWSEVFFIFRSLGYQKS